jgi:hypothetical protein
MALLKRIVLGDVSDLDRRIPVRIARYASPAAVNKSRAGAA